MCSFNSIHTRLHILSFMLPWTSATTQGLLRVLAREGQTAQYRCCTSHNSDFDENRCAWRFWPKTNINGPRSANRPTWGPVGRPKRPKFWTSKKRVSGYNSTILAHTKKTFLATICGILGRAFELGQRLLFKHCIVIAYAVSCCLLP